MSIITLIDTIWISIAIIGISVSAWAVIDSLLDDRARRDSGLNGMRRVVTVIHLRTAEAGLVLHAFFLVLGVLSVTATVRPRPTAFYVVVAAGYILVAAMNVRSVGLNQFDRMRIRRHN